MSCEHESVKFYIAERGEAWLCLKCRQQVGVCSKGDPHLPPDQVEDLVKYAIEMRAEHEAVDRRLGRKK